MQYFPQSQVYLKEVLGDVYEFDFSLFESDKSPEGIEKVLSRMKPLNSLGEDYENLYVPCIPSTDIKSSIPSTQGLVYIKSDSGLQAMPSGKRSCIIYTNGQFVRLKGCGNLLKEFNVEPMAYPVDGQEIRGCCFEHTVIREQFMTWHINLILSNHNYFTGNIPLRYWRYNYSHLPLIEKFCGVYQTLGEKRLGSHLIAGADLILSKLEKYCDADTLMSMFHHTRKKNSGLTPTVKVLKNQGPLNTSLKDWTLQGIYTDNDILLNILEKDPEFMCVSDDPFIDTELSSIPTSPRVLLKNLSKLVWRIGWEVGCVKRIFQDYDVSWGYFIDHNPFEPHCNAHCNNFIVLDRTNENILAPVDFDMAFRKQEFISTVEGSKYGTYDEELFDNWVNCERISLEYTLAGQENMANFKYSDLQGTCNLIIALKDLAVLAFRTSFELKPNNFYCDRKDFEDTIKMCLNLTDNIVDY
jgi:hypothetical protein